MTDGYGEIHALVTLMRQRDVLLDQILFGMKDVEASPDWDLVIELERKVAEAQLLSNKITAILEPTHQ
jgi:hypothetical protein